jgi:hypothetical protein
MNTGIKIDISVNGGCGVAINGGCGVAINGGCDVAINGGCDVSYSTEFKDVRISCGDNLNLDFNLENFDPTGACHLQVTSPNRNDMIIMVPFTNIQFIINNLLSNSEELRELLPWLRFLDEDFKLKMLKCFKFCNKLIEDLATHRQMYPNFDILLIEDPQKTTESIIIMYNSFF